MSEPASVPGVIEPAIIEVNGLTKTYQVGDVPVQALRGVNLEVRKGEFVAIGQIDPVSHFGWPDTGNFGRGADQWARSGGHEQLGTYRPSQDRGWLRLPEVQFAAYFVRRR